MYFREATLHNNDCSYDVFAYETSTLIMNNTAKKDANEICIHIFSNEFFGMSLFILLTSMFFAQFYGSKFIFSNDFKFGC